MKKKKEKITIIWKQNRIFFADPRVKRRPKADYFYFFEFFLYYFLK